MSDKAIYTQFVSFFTQQFFQDSYLTLTQLCGYGIRLQSMTLQDIFYFLAIMFMVLSVLIGLALVFLIFYVKRSVDQVHSLINEKIEYFTKMTSAPAEMASGLGAAVARGIRKALKRK